MNIRTAEFVISNTKQDRLPAANMPEYAFIGRSNVGKSSLINMLCNKKGLAKTSQNPGKTQVINHFIINDKWYLVDLPGYGFAKTARTNRAAWEKMIKTYLESRENLQCVMALIDSRLSPQKNDIEFINWLGSKGIPFSIVFTKADKQSKLKTQANVELFTTHLLQTWEELPAYFVTSAEEQTGKDELLNYIDSINSQYVAQSI
ncbi:MAG: ribosome biogenesis GTP-binding protein YihA/YsxC [Sphingobacteriaceae bacterium]|jgi:GTP-binding protein